MELSKEPGTNLDIVIEFWNDSGLSRTVGTADFLKDLPCHNRLNFQNLDPNGSALSGGRHSSSVKRPPVFIQTKDYPEELVLITTEKTNILLRYLQQQIDKKNKKREANKEEVEGSPRKQLKLATDG